MSRKSFWCWVGWFLFLLALDFTFPFLYLKNIPTVTGSFVFWLLWIIVAIISMFFMFLQWRDDETNQ